MFKDKVVLITGAVRNTGLALAEAFAKEGAIIALNGRKAEDVTRVAARLRQEYGIKVVEAVADVQYQDQVDTMFALIKKECGKLDVLVNNAIVQGLGYTILDTPREMLEELFRINVFGTYACSQGAARMMVEAGSGAIVTIGSNTAIRALKDRTAYVASKGAADALTRAMAVELGPHGVRVNSVVAGYIHSDRWATLPEGVAERRRKNIPLGKEAMGSDIADSVLFIASEKASKITGTRLVVDGGTSSTLMPADCDG